MAVSLPPHLATILLAHPFNRLVNMLKEPLRPIGARVSWAKDTVVLLGSALKEQTKEKFNAVADWFKNKTGGSSAGPAAMMPPSGLPYAGMYDAGGYLLRTVSLAST